CSAAAAASASETSSTASFLDSSKSFSFGHFDVFSFVSRSCHCRRPSTPVDLTRPASARESARHIKPSWSAIAPIVQAFTASRLPRLDLDDGGGGGLGSYGLGIYEGPVSLSGRRTDVQPSVRFVEPSLTTQKRIRLRAAARGGLLALGTEQERKAQAAARQKAEYAKEATEIKTKRERRKNSSGKRKQKLPPTTRKGGGGAPIKDAQGNTRANLKQVMRETDDDRLSNSGHRAAATGDGLRRFSRPRRRLLIGSRTGRFSRSRRLMQQLDGLKDLQTRLSKSFTDDFGGFSNATAANATNSRQQKDVQQQEKQQQQQPQHARGGHGIFGRGLSDEQKRQRERYQEELRQ
uniref:FoP_duplication domain-containing protein n=1 Tax=Macrostomum lignano TaxID=282301 RepID=A0A1I8FEI7_9PLAT